MLEHLEDNLVVISRLDSQLPPTPPPVIQTESVGSQRSLRFGLQVTSPVVGGHRCNLTPVRLNSIHFLYVV